MDISAVANADPLQTICCKVENIISKTNNVVAYLRVIGNVQQQQNIIGVFSHERGWRSIDQTGVRNWLGDLGKAQIYYLVLATLDCKLLRKMFSILREYSNEANSDILHVWLRSHLPGYSKLVSHRCHFGF